MNDLPLPSSKPTLVERLRQLPLFPHMNRDVHELMCEAADEIERLQRRLASIGERHSDKHVPKPRNQGTLTNRRVK